MFEIRTIIAHNPLPASPKVGGGVKGDFVGDGISVVFVGGLKPTLRVIMSYGFGGGVGPGAAVGAL